MKLVYFTAQKYPSKKTEPFFWRSMAEAFARQGGFTFVVRDTPPGALGDLPVVSIDTPGRSLLLFYLFNLPRLIRAHGWDTPDTIFFGQDPYLLALLIFWRSIRRYRYRIASDWHQLFGDWRDRYIARGSDWRITTSERLKGQLARRTGVAGAQICVAYGGVDLALFREIRTQSRRELRSRFSFPPNTILVGYAGSFTSVAGGKGLDIMLEALAHLGSEYRMVLAGGRGSELETYRRLARERGVEDRSIFLPWLPYAELAACQAALDVVVIPYPDTPHYRDQGFPMKVWEYMAAARPIAYADLPVIREVLEGRGAPFTPGSGRSLAEAILAIRDAGSAAERIAEENGERAEAYTWDARAARVLAHIRGTL